MANKIGITVSIKLVNAPDRTERNCKGLRLAITGSLGFKKAEGLRKRKAKRWLPAMGCFFLVKVTSHRFVIAKHYAGIVPDFPTQPRGKSRRRFQGRKQLACPQSHRSTADQPLASLVDQDVGDGGTSRRFQPATHRGIAGRQLLDCLQTRRSGDQQPQLLFSFLEGFLLSHQSPYCPGWNQCLCNWTQPISECLWSFLQAPHDYSPALAAAPEPIFRRAMTTDSRKRRSFDFTAISRAGTAPLAPGPIRLRAWAAAWPTTGSPSRATSARTARLPSPDTFHSASAARTPTWPLRS